MNSADLALNLLLQEEIISTREFVLLSLRAEKKKIDEGITIDVVLCVVAHHYCVEPEMIVSHQKRKELVEPKQVVMYLGHKYANSSIKELCDVFNTNASTVIYGISKIEELEKTDVKLTENITEIKKELRIRERNRKHFEWHNAIVDY